jgi:hypothetical protein
MRWRMSRQSMPSGLTRGWNPVRQGEPLFADKHMRRLNNPRCFPAVSVHYVNLVHLVNLLHSINRQDREAPWYLALVAKRAHLCFKYEILGCFN